MSGSRVWSRPAGPSTVNLLEMHINGPHPRRIESESPYDRAQTSLLDAEVWGPLCYAEFYFLFLFFYFIIIFLCRVLNGLSGSAEFTDFKKNNSANYFMFQWSHVQDTRVI